jgi:hypothetical protein
VVVLLFLCSNDERRIPLVVVDSTPNVDACIHHPTDVNS